MCHRLLSYCYPVFDIIIVSQWHKLNSPRHQRHRRSEHRQAAMKLDQHDASIPHQLEPAAHFSSQVIKRGWLEHQHKEISTLPDCHGMTSSSLEKWQAQLAMDYRQNWQWDASRTGNGLQEVLAMGYRQTWQWVSHSQSAPVDWNQQFATKAMTIEKHPWNV